MTSKARSMLAMMWVWLSSAPIALADPAVLDASFGSGGISNPYLAGSFTPSRAQAGVRLQDGKIVAAGCVFLLEGSELLCRYALARYDASGALDASFADAGTFLGDYPNSEFADVAVQADGRIVAVGQINTLFPWTQGTFVWIPSALIARYQADGSIDPSFGSNGRVIVPGASLFAPHLYTDLLILPSGRIVVLGSEWGNAYLTRFLPDGTFDTSLGGTGRVAIPGGARAFMVRQPGGKLVIGGGSSNTVVTRVDGNGVPDPGFGSNGIVNVDVSALAGGSGNDYAMSAVLEPDGKIVTAGLAAGRPTLVRFLSDGTLDPSFGSGGVAWATDAGVANGIERAGDGSLVVAISRTATANTTNIQITRFLSDGSLDEGFGPGGSVVTPIGIHDHPREVILHDNKALLVGEAGVGAERFALIRYVIADEVPPPVSLVSERGRFAAWMGLGLGLLGWLLLRSGRAPR
jgi:uncharacterized delta-60 repeat protein